MRISEILLAGEKKLRRSASPRLDCEVLLAHILDVDRTTLYAHITDYIPPQIEQAFQRLIRLRARRVPIAYLIGHQDTPAGKLQVDPRVLVPRPSTELLIQSVIEQLSSDHGILADIGTGSGVIAISLAKALPDFQIEASDVSPAALELAQANARAHDVDQRITWRFGSLMQPWYQILEPDVIVANLPYVSTATVRKNRTPYEPHVALHGGQDGLALIKMLIHQLQYHPLVQMVALECQPDQVDAVAYLLRSVRPTPFAVSPIQDGPTSWGVVGRR